MLREKKNGVQKRSLKTELRADIINYAGLESTRLDPYGKPSGSISTTTLPSVCVPLEIISGFTGSLLVCVPRRLFSHIDLLDVDLPVVTDLRDEVIFCVTFVLVSVIVVVVTDMLLTSRSTGHMNHIAVGFGMGNPSVSSPSEYFPPSCSDLRWTGSSCSSLTTLSLHFGRILTFLRLSVIAGPTFRRSGANAIAATTITEMDVSAVVQTALKSILISMCADFPSRLLEKAIETYRVICH